MMADIFQSYYSEVLGGRSLDLLLSSALTSAQV